MEICQCFFQNFIINRIERGESKYVHVDGYGRRRRDSEGNRTRKGTAEPMHRAIEPTQFQPDCRRKNR